MRISTNCEDYFYDFFQQIRPFLPNAEIVLADEENAENSDEFELVHYLEKDGKVCTNFVTISKFQFEDGTKKKINQSTFCREDKLNDTSEKYVKNTCKLAIYTAMSEYFGVKMPWGALTGVRPTKIALNYYDESHNFEYTKDCLVNDYYLQENKAQLLVDVIKNQVPIEIDDKSIDFYVHIPFCTTRCSYCTFLSMEIGKAKQFVEPYVETLKDEIIFTKELLKRKGYRVANIYVGGGTPTSLTSEQLDYILCELKDMGAREFTVEAGRPDTITREKLDVLLQNGVTRISINPQTFNEKSLKAIGRAHTGADVLSAYKLAREYPFQINMDLIVGLPLDDVMFAYSLDKTIALAPDNITVHTLSLKTHSPLTKTQTIDTVDAEQVIKNNLELAESKLKDSGYSPYYLYRQKNMVGNLENVGYCKPNCVCNFNINSMEDFSSVIACGANAISKRIFPAENRIERAGNVKDIITYLSRIDDMKAKKAELFA